MHRRRRPASGVRPAPTATIRAGTTAATTTPATPAKTATPSCPMTTRATTSPKIASTGFAGECSASCLWWYAQRLCSRSCSVYIICCCRLFLPTCVRMRVGLCRMCVPESSHSTEPIVNGSIRSASTMSSRDCERNSSLVRYALLAVLANRIFFPHPPKRILLSPFYVINHFLPCLGRTE